MLIAHGHKVRGDCVVVRLFHSRRGERARDEEAGGRIGGFRRLMGMQRAAVIFWGTKLVSEEVRCVQMRPSECTHLLLGNGRFRPRDEASGSNLTSPGFGAGTSNEDDSKSASLGPLITVASPRRESRHLLHMDGRASNRHVRASRTDSSGAAIMFEEAMLTPQA